MKWVGAAGLQRLQRPQHRRILFNSFNGQFSDSPRAIYEELARRGPHPGAVWVGERGGRAPEPRTVPFYSWPYYLEAGRAGYIVSNLQMPTNFHKRASVTYLQTWHGTPLKRIGFDNPRWAANPSGLKDMARDCKRWDYLISQNAFSTEIFRRAFRFDGEILETGYPRNDVLNAPERGEIRTRVRRRLGLKDGERAILYAPTWRDNLVASRGPASFSLALDVPGLAGQLGDGYALLLRLHHKVARGAADTSGSFARNVTDHPDIRELYLAADVLVTDYSSAMFDFAVTGKPVLFYTYDLAEYRDEFRGFYFDLEAEAPGPLCRTTTELADALSDLDRVSADYAENYARFRKKFCSLDDGTAARRVADRVFGAGPA